MSDTRKKRGVLSFFKGPKFRHGWYAILLTALFIALVIGLNVIVGAAEEKWGLRIDATANKMTNFSDQTYSVIDGIEEDVNVYLVYEQNHKDDYRVAIEEITSKYQARNSHIKVGTIDPMREPNKINKYTQNNSEKTMNNGAMIVTNADETRVKLVTSSEMKNYSMDQNTGSYYVSGFNGESKLTTALMYVTSKTTPMVYFLTGHEEIPMSSSTVLSNQLQSENYDVAELTLGPDVALKAGDTVLINVPSKDLMDEEYEILKTFLSDGGRMMFVNDFRINYDQMPNFTSLLDYYSLAFESGLVIEDESATSNWLMDPTYLIPVLNTEDDITTPLQSAAKILMPLSGAIRSPEVPLSGYRYTNLLTSSDRSYFKDITSESSTIERAPDDRPGPFTLAMSILRQNDTTDQTKDTRIVLIANPYITVDNSYLNSTSNLDFAMNSFDWLSNREVSVYIRAKSFANTTLNIPDAGTFWLLAAIVVVVIPVIILIVGVTVHIRRRRL